MSDDPESGWFYFEAVGLAILMIAAAVSMVAPAFRALKGLL